MSLDARAVIVVEAVAKQAIAEFQRTGKSLGELDRQSRKSAEGGKTLGQSLSSIKVSAAAAGIAIAGAIAVIKKGFQFAREGAEILELKQAGESLAQSFGQSMSSIVRSIKEGSGSTISEMEAIGVATKALNLGVITSEKQFGQLAAVAEALGDRLGKSTAESMADVTQALTMMNSRALASAGITTDAEAIWKSYATSIGKSVKDLTDAEKRTALLEDATKRLGGQALSTADQFDRMAAAGQDASNRLKASWAQFTAPAVKAAADWLTMNNRISDSIALLKRHGMSQDEFSRAVGVSTENATVFYQALLRWATEQDRATAADKGRHAALAQLNEDLQKLDGFTARATVIISQITTSSGTGTTQGSTAATRGFYQEKAKQAATQAAFESQQKTAKVTAQQHGGELTGFDLVGDPGPNAELIVGNTVIPARMTRELMRLGLVPGRKMQAGGVLIDGLVGSGGSYQSSGGGAISGGGTAAVYKQSKYRTGRDKSTGIRESFGGADATSIAATQAATQQLGQQGAAETQTVLAAVASQSQQIADVIAGEITRQMAQTIRVTAETNALLRGVIAAVTATGNSQRTGSAVAEALVRTGSL